MAELSERSGVPAPTIRYYLREGLLAPGRLTSPNQATYDDSHVRRLRLVRALLDVGGLSVEAAKGVVTAMEAKAGNEFGALGQVQYGLSARRGPAAATEPPPAAVERVDDLIARHGWQVREHNPARASLASALATLQEIGRDELLASLDSYASAADTLAQREVDELLALDEDARAEAVVAATVLGDAVLSALRRLAQESALAERLTSGETDRSS